MEEGCVRHATVGQVDGASRFAAQKVASGTMIPHSVPRCQGSEAGEEWGLSDNERGGGRTVQQPAVGSGQLGACDYLAAADSSCAASRVLLEVLEGRKFEECPHVDHAN